MSQRSGNEEEERERAAVGGGALGLLLMGAVGAAAVHFSIQQKKAGDELADTILDVYDRELQNEAKNPNPKSPVGVDDKLHPLPQKLEKFAAAKLVKQYSNNTMWKFILRDDLKRHLSWLFSENMSALGKRDKRESVSTVAWKRGYQAILTRRYKENEEEDSEGKLLDVVATFVLTHGSSLDPLFRKKDDMLGLNNEQNARLVAVGKFLNDLKLKHFFGKKRSCVEISRFYTNQNFEGIERLCVAQVIQKTNMPVVYFSADEEEKDRLIEQAGFEVKDEAEMKHKDGGFKCWLLVAR